MRWLPGTLAVAGLLLLVLVPVTFTESNGEGRCDGSVKEAESYSVRGFLLTGQRQNATCDDARQVRGIYTGLAVLVTALTWWRSVPMWFGWIGRIAVILLAVAAILDGPLVPAGLVAIGGALALMRRGPEAEAERA